MTHVDHAWRHRPKALGGTDPLEFTSGGVFTTYRDCVLSDPTTLHLWPMDDASGNLVDAVGSIDMVPTTHGGFPTYGNPGPFAGIPLQTSVQNNNVAGQARFSVGVSLPATTTPFTLQGWLYQAHASNGGYVWEDWAGGGGGDIKLLIIDSTTLLITYSHGNGLTVSGGALVFQTWTHIRVDYDGTTLRLLQDGVVLATDTGSGSGTQSNNHFLNTNNTGGAGFAPFHGRAALWSLHDGDALDCAVLGEGGGSDAPAGYAPVADGSGGVDWTDVATQTEFEAHVDDTIAAHPASAIALVDAAGDFTATEAEGAFAELQAADEADEAALAAHLADTVDAHDASAVSIVDAGGYFTGAEVEAALQELGAASGGGAAGRWEIVMEDGITSPPVPITNEAEDDWLYVLVED